MLDKNKEAILKEIVFQGLIERAHFNNLTEDDEFSKKAFERFECFHFWQES